MLHNIKTRQIHKFPHNPVFLVYLFTYLTECWGGSLLKCMIKNTFIGICLELTINLWVLGQSDRQPWGPVAALAWVLRTVPHQSACCWKHAHCNTQHTPTWNRYIHIQYSILYLMHFKFHCMATKLKHSDIQNLLHILFVNKCPPLSIAWYSFIQECCWMNEFVQGSRHHSTGFKCSFSQLRVQLPTTVPLCPTQFVIAPNNYITFISQRLFCIMISLT